LKLDENTDVVAVKKFICGHGYPGAEEISQAVYQRLEQCGRPFVIYFYTDKQQADSFINSWLSKFQGMIGFSIADAARWKDVLVRMGGSGNVLPSLVAFAKTSKGNDKTLAWDEETPITDSSLESWFNSLIEGTAKGYLKSEPIPEANDKGVKVIVGKTFNSIVYDSSKDVLVEYYAPWCPHCKNIEPIYTGLGELLKTIAPNVVVAKIDATANSLPDDVSVAGFPTIHFFPANDKANPLPYDGNRSLRDLATFVQSHATVKFDIDLSQLPEDEPEEDEEYEEEEQEEYAEEAEEDYEDEDEEGGLKDEL
jgi:protein disulfide isomerase